MAENVDREKLYNEVWTTPLTTLCRSYELSYAGMKRLCDELNIPVSQRGHWARVAAGKALTKPELPSLDSPVLAMPAKPKAAELRKKPASSAEQPPSPPDAPLHRIIKPLQRLYEDAEKQALEGKAEFDWEQAHPGKRYRNAKPEVRFFSWEWFCKKGEILLPTPKKSVLKVSIRIYKRALRLLSDLTFSLEGTGFVVKLTEGNGRLEASRAGAAVFIRISEKLDTGYKTVTNSWSGSSPEKVWSPTGMLVIHVEQEGWGNSPLSDSKSGSLEDQWSLILEGVERQHASSVRWRTELAEDQKARDEKERLRQLEVQRLADIRAREEAEAKRRLELAHEAEKWKSAEHIREYVSHLVAGAAAAGCAGPEFDAWVAWAKDAADLLDPSLTRLRSLRTKPEAGDA